MGYSRSSATLNPEIAYAGRLATDTADTFSQTETVLIAGTGSQSGNCGSSTCVRWGDYSAMTLDPDGCTFWYTSEYYATTDLNDLTRIGSFTFPGCTPLGSGGTLSGTVTDQSTSDPISGATVALGSRTTTTAADGTYSFASLPAGTYPALTVSDPGYATASTSSVGVTDGNITTKPFALSATPASGTFLDDTQTDFQTGTASGTDFTSTPGSVQLLALSGVDQLNESVTNNGFGFNATSWAGQTFTPAQTGKLSKVALDLFCSNCTGTTPALTVSIRATTGSPAVPTGADLASGTITGFNSGAGGFYSASFASPTTVSAGTTYAIVVRAAANPSAGTYAYVCSCSTDSNPYAGGQRVTSGNGGSSWVADTAAGGRDLGFQVFIESGYPPSGTYVSSAKDINPPAGTSRHWGTLSFDSVTPTGTTVTFQVAGSNSPDGPFTFVGSDGTPGSTFSSGSSLSQFDGNRYLEYRAALTTANSTVTPTLQDVSISFHTLTPQKITFTGAPATAAYNSSFDVTATSDSNLPVTVTSSGACTNTGTHVTMTTGTGTCALTAKQAGNGSYDPATDAHQSTTATKLTQTVNLTAPSNKVYGDAPFSVSGSATSGLPVTLGVTGPCSLASGQVTITGAGTCTLSGDQAGNSNYAGAPTAQSGIVIGKATQSITFGALRTRTYGAAPFTVTATSSGGLPVSFHASGPCTVASHKVHLTGAGSCKITASQAGDANHAAATPVTRSFTIRKAKTTVTVAASPSTVKKGGYIKLTAHVSPTSVGGAAVTGTVRFAIDGTFVGSASVRNGVAVLSKLKVKQGSGKHAVTAKFVSARSGVAGSKGSSSLKVK
jgi:hypothetical protein